MKKTELKLSLKTQIKRLLSYIAEIFCGDKYVVKNHAISERLLKKWWQGEKWFNTLNLLMQLLAHGNIVHYGESCDIVPLGWAPTCSSVMKQCSMALLLLLLCLPLKNNRYRMSFSGSHTAPIMDARQYLSCETLSDSFSPQTTCVV